MLHNPGLGYAMAMGMVFIMGGSDRRLHRCCSAEPSGGADEATSRLASPGGSIFLLGVLYFILPLYATLVFSLKAKPFLSAYTSALSDPKFFASLGLLDGRRASSRSSPAWR